MILETFPRHLYTITTHISIQIPPVTFSGYHMLFKVWNGLIEMVCDYGNKIVPTVLIISAFLWLGNVACY